MLENAASSVPADAQCVIPPSLLPRLALQFDHAKDEIQCRGDASLLAEIFYLSRNLRWDAADDLSRVTGDLVAERIVRFAQTGRTQMDEGLANLTQGISEYLTEEQPSLATPRHVATFLFQVDTLRDDVSRLEQRISRISSALPTGSVTKVAR